MDGDRLAEPHDVPGTDDAGLKTWVKLMVHADHDTLHAGRPLFFEIVRRLRAAGAGGATVLHGIWGYHGDRAPQGDRLLSLRRHVPATTIVVDNPERIGAWFSIIDELTDQGGVVTSELVPAFHARGTWGEAGGLTLAEPRRYAVGVVARRRPKWVRSVVAVPKPVRTATCSTGRSVVSSRLCAACVR